MKHKIVILLLLLGMSAVFLVLYMYFDTPDAQEVQEFVEAGSNAEYEQTYLSFVYDEDGAPIGLDALGDGESNIFIGKIIEEKLDPTNILQAGNELYFVSPLDKDGVKGEAIMLYDVIDRKLYVLFFRSLQELLQDGRELSLVAIDVVNSKLIFAYIPQEMNCSSLWLGVSEYLFSLELYTGTEPKIEKYRMPTWKVEEERVKNPNCTF